MKIISGTLKYKNLYIPPLYITRPTKNAVREAVFNVLNNYNVIKKACVLDIYAGSGSLAFEALSRGASKIYMIENNFKAINVIYKNINALNITEEKVEVLQLDARKITKSVISADLIFIDPPYNQGFTTCTLNSLLDSGWLKENTLIVIELNKKENFTCPKDFYIELTRTYGISKIILLKHLSSFK